MSAKPLSGREWLMVVAIGFLAALVVGQVVAGWLPTKGSLADWAGVASAIAAFTAIGLGAFGFVETTRANKLEHRAYVRAEVELARIITSRLTAVIVLENYGRTPAANIFLTGNAYIDQSVIEGDKVRHWTGDELGRVSLKLSLPMCHPNNIVSLEITTDEEFERVAVEAVRGGIATLVIETAYGYEDVFGDKRADVARVAYRGPLQGADAGTLQRILIPDGIFGG